ncbi:uncharacterized protein LOC110253614 [Exaiptasia diaphana]|uniref:Uncharacterized protein n=1 Tax=Exaiptasia diaphana TaxID=2652724 RepID=A0A913Y775_EXADI|nr:uncharacterized protein LOC110253614 [Exaiptasia diaphana]
MGPRCSVFLVICLMSMLTTLMCYPTPDDGSGHDAQQKGKIPGTLKLTSTIPVEADNSQGLYMHSHPGFKRFLGSPHKAMHSQYMHSMFGRGRKRSLSDKMMKIFKIRD